MKKNILLLLLTSYVLLFSFFFVTRYAANTFQPLHFFIPDHETITRNNNAISSDLNTKYIFLTRVFHNKIIAYSETFFISIFRTVDPVFLFSLSDFNVMYSERIALHALYPFELLLLFLAVVYCIRKKNQTVSSNYFLFVTGIIMIFIGVTLPHIHPLKILPLLLLIRIFIAYQFYCFVKGGKWFKK